MTLTLHDSNEVDIYKYQHDRHKYLKTHGPKGTIYGSSIQLGTQTTIDITINIAAIRIETQNTQ